MRVIDRLYRFIQSKNLQPGTFEKECNISNGYLGKQFRGKGAIGSDILERIHHKYPELDLMWLITGKGNMLIAPGSYTSKENTELLLQEENAVYQTKSKMVTLLLEQLEVLETAFPETKKKRRKPNS